MGVRIDQLLHWLCLAKSRSLAARGCRQQRVLVNGEPARPARAVRAGDELTLVSTSGRQRRRLRIRDLPACAISRKQAREHYEVLEESAQPIDLDREGEIEAGG